MIELLIIINHQILQWEFQLILNIKQVKWIIINNHKHLEKNNKHKYIVYKHLIENNLIINNKIMHQKKIHQEKKYHPLKLKRLYLIIL